ncbi:MAG TPA: hypothetical protein VEB64_18755 [Azospirillaceae bacterium]|nr:hypothetical protein [Azospirillaceae bacterium]
MQIQTYRPTTAYPSPIRMEGVRRPPPVPAESAEAVQAVQRRETPVEKVYRKADQEGGMPPQMVKDKIPRGNFLDVRV